MTIIFPIPLSLLLLVISFGCGEGVVVEDLKLEERNGVMYLPNHEEPYTGEYLKWHENGQKQEEGTYKDGKEDGRWMLYDENGQKEFDTTYKDGKEDGLETLWYENGQKATEAMHKAGKKNGLATLWYENGQKWNEITYKDGNPDGRFTGWHESGEKHFDGAAIIRIMCFLLRHDSGCYDKSRHTNDNNYTTRATSSTTTCTRSG